MRGWTEQDRNKNTAYKTVDIQDRYSNTGTRACDKEVAAKIRWTEWVVGD